MPRLKPLNKTINRLLCHNQGIITRTGLNVGGGNTLFKKGVSEAENQPVFNMFLTNSLTVNRYDPQGQIGTLDSFTRGASTAGTIIDHEGVIRDVTANEARFLGARRVENLDQPLAEYVSGSPSVTREFDHEAQIATFTWGIDISTSLLGSTTIHSWPLTTKEYIYSVEVRSIVEDKPPVSVGIKGIQSTSVDVTSSVTSEWKRFSSVVESPVVDTLEQTGIVCEGVIGTKIQIRNPMIEEVTGQTNQNPSEYVSVGVGTEPEHLTNFNSAEWGLTNATLDPATRAVIFPGGLGVAQHPNAEANTKLWEVTYTRSGTSVSSIAPNVYGVALDFQTTNGVFTQVIRGDGASVIPIYFTIIPVGDVTFSNISIKEIDHGSNVDGVKYFDTLNGNTVTNNVITEVTGAAIPATTLRGILIENGSTNRLLDSEVFLAASSAWSNQGCTPVIHSTEVSPMGSKNVTDLFADNLGGTSDAVQVLQAASMVVDVPLSFSVYAKANTLDWMSLETAAFTTGNGNSFFDLANGVVGNLSTAHEDSYMEDMGNGWYRCVVTVADVGSDNNGIFRIRLASANGNNVVNLDGTEGIYIVGAQAEAIWARATSYMPTEGSTTNRGIEQLTYELPSAIAAVIPELSVYAECYQWYNSGVLSRAISIDSATSGDIYYMAASATASWMTIAYDGGTVGIAEGIADADGTKLCDALIDGSLSLTQDGRAEVTDITAPANMDFSNSDATFDIGSQTGTGQFLNGTVKNVKLWNKALTEAQRITLTT